MRIIAGQFGGIPLVSAGGQHTRPTSDKVKESVFNLLGQFFSGGWALDMYAGSGALGLEALSRGVDHVVALENNRQAFKAIQANVKKCQAEEALTCHFGHNERILTQLKSQEPELKFDYVFLDPPYAKEHLVLDMTFLAEKQLLVPRALITCECDVASELPEKFADFTCLKQATYGQTLISIYTYLPKEEPNDH